MWKEAIFTMKLAAGLHSRFMDEAEAANRPALQVVPWLRREFAQRQREARAYEAFLRRSSNLPGHQCTPAWAGRMIRLRSSSLHGAGA